MKTFFVTATGTNIGKTFATAALAFQLRQRSLQVRALKPIISGFTPTELTTSDTGMLLAAQGLPVTLDLATTISPWRFTAALSPDMAAEDEGRAIDLQEVVSFCQQQPPCDVLFIEGVGGVMVPLNATSTVRDWMLALDTPVILIAGSYLGTISHTLSAAEAILSAGLTLHCIIISESEVSPVELSRLTATLKRFLPDHVAVYAINRVSEQERSWEKANDMTRWIV